MKYDITANANLLILTLDTESGTYPAQVQSYAAPASNLSVNTIDIYDFGKRVESLQLHHIKTIATVAPSSLADAETKMLALIATLIPA